MPEPSTIKVIVGTLLKPFSLIFNPIADRIGHKLKRKPKLYIHIHPLTSVWGYAWEGASEKPTMMVRFEADITNDHDHEAVIVLDGYVKGTKSKFPLIRPIDIAPETTAVRQIVYLLVAPVVGEEGKEFTGRIILVDQLKRKHPTDKHSFKWTGPTERVPKPGP